MIAPHGPETDPEAPLHEGTLEVSWSMDDHMITVRPQYDCPCPERFIIFDDELEFLDEVSQELSDIESIVDDGIGIGTTDNHELYCVYVMLRHSPVAASIAQMIGERLSGLTAFDGLTVVIEEDDESGKYFSPSEQWSE